MKRLFKWLIRLFLLAGVLLIIFFLSLDTILRVLMEHRIRAQTGMEAHIGQFSLGLLDPQLTIRDLKLYNTAEFGGTCFLSIPEIHIEYDRNALAQQQIHLTLMRFNLGELDIVKNEAGHTNIFSLGVNLPAPGATNAPGKSALAEFKQRTNLEFKSIDVLNLSVGTAKYIDLKDPSQNRTQNIGIDNLVVKNVKSFGDLAGFSLVLAIRSGNFFSSLVDPQTVNRLW